MKIAGYLLLDISGSSTQLRYFQRWIEELVCGLMKCTLIQLQELQASNISSSDTFGSHLGYIWAPQKSMVNNNSYCSTTPKLQPPAGPRILPKPTDPLRKETFQQRTKTCSAAGIVHPAHDSNIHQKLSESFTGKCRKTAWICICSHWSTPLGLPGNTKVSHLDHQAKTNPKIWVCLKILYP